MVNHGLILGDRYEVVSRIGRGGMADVYKALDRKLNRYVALKVLKREFSEDQRFVNRFRTEAKSAASLAHPNIVNVYDVAEEQGVNYIVMELVEGITLKDYIEKRGCLSTKEAISISIQVAMGIEAAHKNHIIHRDIKPQNIMISKEGKVKVTDFGIARAASSHTASSAQMGSVHYTSPEQARGGFSDARSDIYSLGITMYEMITGRVPFDGDSTVAVAIKHLQEEVVPPSAYVEDIPYAYEQIILKCIQKSPESRYFSMGDLINDLKMSLINPNGTFVKINKPASGETVIFSGHEQSEIVKAYDELEHKKPEAQTKQYDDRNPSYTRMREEERAYDNYDDYDEDEYDDYDDDYKDEYDDELEGFDDEYENKDSYRALKVLTRVLIAIAAILIGAVIIFAVGKAAGVFKFGPSIGKIEEIIPDTSNPTDSEVPNVVGMTYDEAREELNKMGFGIKEVSRETSDKYDVDVVIRQNPASGEKAKENTTVEVVVSSGKVDSDLKIPSVVGLSQDEAQTALENSGFKVDTQFKESDSVPSGVVMSQSPEAGETGEKGDNVTIVVSKGSRETDVPDVVGMKLSDAQDLLKSRGLKLGTTNEEYSADVPEGKIISQSPKKDSKVATKSSVNLVISKGDVPLAQQVWQCSQKINLSGYQGGDIKLVLTQGATSTVVIDGTPVSQSFEFQTNGIPGQKTGTVDIYEYTDEGQVPLVQGLKVDFKRIEE